MRQFLNFVCCAFAATALFTLIPTLLWAQGGADYSLSNEFRYGIGEQTEADQKSRKEYLENLLSARVYLGDFTLGFRLQVDQPREYGRDTVGIKEYYAEFRRDGIHARAGTFYNLVARGLVMNTFESRPIGFDTQTEGVRLDYESPEFTAGAWGGILNYADVLNPKKRLEEYLIRGASGEVRPIQEVGVGGSFLAATGRQTPEGFAREFTAYLREAWLRGNVGGLRTFLNFADKRSVLDSGSRARLNSGSSGYGYGLYGLVGYAGEEFGVTLELKDYRFDLVNPSAQQVGSRSTRALPFQNPPSLIPEHDKALLARNPHTIDINDELGFQVEALLYPIEDLTVTLLALGGSRHSAWERVETVDSNGKTDIAFNRVDALPRSFANLSDKHYSPYWEVYAHGEYQANEDLSLAMAVQRRDNIVFDLSEYYKATTVMLETIAGITERGSLHAIVEGQRVFDSKKSTVGNDSLGISPYDGKFFNVLTTLEYSQSPTWSVNGRLEWTSTDREEGGRRLWPVIGGTYRIGNSHTLGVQYGAERGGVVCTGGVCRFINPFTGFRITLVSKL